MSSNTDPSRLAEINSFGPARSTVEGTPLSPEELRKIDAYWRACNYLALGMIYLRDNPLLREPLKPEHIKNRLLGHWGASPALSFIYTHLNRVISKYDLDTIFMAGPGHGAPGVLAPVYLEGTYSEIYPDKSLDEEGLLRVLQAVLLSRRHRQPLHPGNARLHPRRRRAGLRAVACLRRGLRQSGPDRRRGGGRRRSRDRAAGHLLAHQQVPQSDPRRRGAADPAISTATRSTTRPCWRASATTSWKTCSRATAGRPISSKAPIRTPCTRPWRRPSTTASREIRAAQQRGPQQRRGAPAALADDRAA